MRMEVLKVVEERTNEEVMDLEMIAYIHGSGIGILFLLINWCVDHCSLVGDLARKLRRKI